MQEEVIPNETGQKPNLYAYLTFKGNDPGTVGIAWKGSVCHPEVFIGYRSSINEWYNTDMQTGKVSSL